MTVRTDPYVAAPQSVRPAARVPSRSEPLWLTGMLRHFQPISLEQVDHVALLDRADTKYVLSPEQLARVLPQLAGHYRVLQIDGARVSPYQTLYFDTAGFELYLSHHDGRRNRYKVRERCYVQTGRSFFEVKFKSTDRRTLKRRLETGRMTSALSPAFASFIETASQLPVKPHALQAKLLNTYSRITLVSDARAERVTLDLDMAYSAENRSVVLPGVVIAEVKQAGLTRNSAFVRAMQAENNHSTGFSKYCVGVSLLYPAVKHNNFKPQLILIDKLMQGHTHVH